MISSIKSIAVLGTGMVGKTLATALLQRGYSVCMGSRTAGNEKATAWANDHNNATTATFADAAAKSQLVILCTKGDATLNAVQLAGADALKNKTVIDVTNPLDFSHGMPPSLIPDLCNTNSLGEAVQKLLPNAHVVKTLNIVNCEVMVNPMKSGGEPTMFVCGNNADAKSQVTELLKHFGWNDILDLGDITGARGMEMMLPIWLRVWQASGNGYNAMKSLR